MTFESRVDGAQALAVSAGTGTTRFNADVGGSTALLSLTTDVGGRTEIGASITVSGSTLTFNDPVDLTGPSTLTDTGTTGLAFNSTLDGAQDLTLNITGPSAFRGAVGGITPLGDGVGPSVTINSAGPTIFASTVETASGILIADDAGPVILPDAPGPSEPGQPDPNPVLPEVSQEEALLAVDTSLGVETSMGPATLLGQTIVRADDVVAFLECARLGGDPSELPQNCPEAYASLAEIPERRGLAPVAASGEPPAEMRADQAVVLAFPIGHPARPPSTEQMNALRMYRKLKRAPVESLMARAVRSYRSETGVQEVRGSDLRRYVEQSSAHARALAYLNDIGELLMSLRNSGMARSDLLATEMRVLEQMSPEDLSALELRIAAGGN